ncbi:spore germination protein [Effusibacillus lacus]|uniref:Spore germination protein n=1 Tax=Effusibacillus lacus TaxID=1348429 RepID=A0A292YMW4_9BACL|nr:spore germination protein [Effusibacillus lacus]TCS72289.1 spore germination protein PA [Effusibacillus lacus]GAX90239.1 spore germination protein [Effusibacillus lacus]
MPAILGALKVISVGSSGVVHIGDAIVIAPKSAAKTYAGSGSFNTGDFPSTYNVVSSTNVNDQDIADTNVAGL